MLNSLVAAVLVWIAFVWNPKKAVNEQPPLPPQPPPPRPEDSTQFRMSYKLYQPIDSDAHPLGWYCQALWHQVPSGTAFHKDSVTISADGEEDRTGERLTIECNGVCVEIVAEHSPVAPYLHFFVNGERSDWSENLTDFENELAANWVLHQLRIAQVSQS